MNKVTVALTCPSCAGPLSVREGDTHTVCPSCSSSLLFPNAVRRYVLPSKVTGIDVLRSVRRELKAVNPGSIESARVSRPVLYYVPFWHCSAHVNGYVLGVEPVYHESEVPTVSYEGQSSTGYSVSVTRKIKTRTGSNAVEREIQLSGSVNISAADLEPLGIPDLSADSQLSIQGLDIQRTALPDGLEVLEDEASREGVFVDPLV
ncbi:MAG: zinc ribbon domain-containing protein, partial [Candidatus Fermentibacteria bacterium]